MYAQKAKSQDYQKESTEGHGFNACDTYALAAAINDTLVTKMEQVRSRRRHVKTNKQKKKQAFRLKSRSNVLWCSQVGVSVELEGKYTRGMMVLDYMELLDKKHKAFVMKMVDLEKFKEMLMRSLQ